MITGISNLLQAAIDPVSLYRRQESQVRLSIPQQEATAQQQTQNLGFSSEAVRAAEKENETEKSSLEKDEESEESAKKASQSPLNSLELTEEELKQVEELKQRDREVRTHENAHKAAAGELAVGGPTYTYEKGPDDKRYAVGGEVQIRIPEGGDPQSRLQKAAKAQRAALAPAEPSAQDRAVAAKAAQVAAEARQEIIIEKQEEREETTAAESAEGSPNTHHNQGLEAYRKAAESSFSRHPDAGILV